MSTICADHHHHKVHNHHIEIPPRKQQQLLLRHNNNKTNFDNMHHAAAGLFSADELLHHQKFLPFNNSDGDTDCDSDPYASDHFRIYEFKIRRCTRSRSHDWTDCPFAHPGEKARRRDPRRHNYSGTICSDFRRGGACNRGDDCEFAHGVFECWLHPSRYRTEACKDGKNCKRKVCFFAHTPRQLRILPEIIVPENEKHNHKSHCCMFCHSQLTNSSSNSPTSTLFGLSHLSPPLSPVSQRSSPVSRLSKFSNINNNPGFAPSSYNESLAQLMNSLEAMNVNHEIFSPKFNNDEQFVLSPSTPVQRRSFFNNGDSSKGIFGNDNNYGDGLLAGSSSPDHDLGWVNDLLK